MSVPSIECRIISKKDISLNINNERKTLEKVGLLICGFVTVKVLGKQGYFLSKPIPFKKVETFILCAPEGTDIRCKFEDFNCMAFLQCKEDNEGNPLLEAVKLTIDACASVQSEKEVPVELFAKHSEPRQESCNSHTTSYTTTNKEYQLMCMNLPKLYDWVVRDLSIDMTLDVGEITFYNRNKEDTRNNLN
ncbi:hypothetical protein [Evansella tamaricis]|uniref:Uncharacterized protein n=1 Tax=Evansella tamaricis TaxID=2069301 RepID=A0ABS6JIV9_9BACI|nr:hypothetical protein [Evansella tamaricis]MBU9713325.1 hypothetical protein [Evansella tamaricis]